MLTNIKVTSLVLLVLLMTLVSATRNFHYGRLKGGNLKEPVSDLRSNSQAQISEEWILQKVDNFDKSNHATWKQVGWKMSLKKYNLLIYFRNITQSISFLTQIQPQKPRSFLLGVKDQHQKSGWRGVVGLILRRHTNPFCSN